MEGLEALEEEVVEQEDTIILLFQEQRILEAAAVEAEIHHLVAMAAQE
jgi:hypothetical protein